MKRDAFDNFCGSLKATTNVVQWGNSSVWKVGGKVFAICGDWGRQDDAIVLKPSEMAAEIWRGAHGVRLAPYLGRAGWIQIDHDAMSDDERHALIEGSYAINAAKLTRKLRAELGIG